MAPAVHGWFHGVHDVMGQSMMKREGPDTITSAEVLEELIAFTCAGLAAPEVTGMSNPLHRQEQEAI